MGKATNTVEKVQELHRGHGQQAFNSSKIMVAASFIPIVLIGATPLAVSAAVVGLGSLIVSQATHLYTLSTADSLLLKVKHKEVTDEQVESVYTATRTTSVHMFKVFNAAAIVGNALAVLALIVQ